MATENNFKITILPEIVATILIIVLLYNV